MYYIFYFIILTKEVGGVSLSSMELLLYKLFPLIHLFLHKLLYKYTL